MALKDRIASLMPRTTVLRIKYFNQLLYRIRTKKKKINTKLEIHRLSKHKTHVYFGYYDVSPFNVVSDELVYMNLNEKENKLHLFKTTLTQLSSEVELAESYAWNWQQGCRLRWMPNNSREIIFNDFDGTKYFARILNVDTKSERRIDCPLYDISSDGIWGLSINFERLGAKRPGYGYTCLPYVESEHNIHNEFIEIVNIADNNKRKILTFDDIIRIPGCETVDIKNNYVNHLCFSPSGRQFLFFWLTADTDWHKAFLLVYNIETKKIKLLENKEKVSHYVWQDENNIICTAADDKQKWHYYLYNVNTGKKEELNPHILNVDGHPSIFNEKQILTDTYPDVNGYQRLYITNKNNGGYQPLIEIYSHCCKDGERRTDLHPRLNKDHTLICFDANINGFRTLNIIKLNGVN